MTSCTVVRPYHLNIREKVIDLLTRLKLEVEPRDIIEPGTSDRDVVATLKERPHPVVVVPFHAHSDEHGNKVTGLDFVVDLDKRAPELGHVAILMPISQMARAGANLVLARDPDNGGVTPSLRERVLLLPEDELNTPDLRQQVRKHLEKVLGPEVMEVEPQG